MKLLYFGLLLFLLACCARFAIGADDSWRDSFDSMGSLPWYDADNDRVDPVAVEPRIDDSTNRDSRWLPKPAKAPAVAPANPQTNPNNATRRTHGPWQAFWTVIRDLSSYLGWGLLAIVVAVTVGLIVYMFSKMEDAARGVASPREDDPEMDEADATRLENLPIQVERPRGDLLGEADRLNGLGRYAEAIVYLFGHRLIQLDRAHAIRLARGKTNRQYLAELRSRPDLARLMRETVQTFEQSYFGRYEITQTQFDITRRAQAEFDRLLAVNREAA
jgi:hypothetical protein